MAINQNIVDAAHIAVLNADLKPDPRMNGTTDCYLVPIDDIERLRDLLESINRKTT